MTEPVTQLPAGIPSDEDFATRLEQVATEKGRGSHFVKQYDDAVFEWIGKVVGIEGIPIRRIRSTPLRAFADYKCLLAKEDPRLAETLKDAPSLVQFPLPLAVIGRGQRTWRAAWGNSKAAIRNIRFPGGPGKRRTSYMRSPRPIDLAYKIDFYARMEIHMRWIVEQVEAQFWPLAYARIESPYPNVSREDFRYMPIKYDGFTDNSELEPGEAGDRMLRETLSIVVEGFQWFDEMQAPTLHRIITERHDSSTYTQELNDESPETATEVEAAIPSAPATDGMVEA